MIGVLIDDYAVRADEIRITRMALRLFKELSLGNFGHLERFLDVALALELQGDPETICKIRSLLKRINSVVWKERSPLTVYDPTRVSVSGLIAHGLERRLAGDSLEVGLVEQNLRSRGYETFSTRGLL